MILETSFEDKDGTPEVLQGQFLCVRMASFMAV